MKVQIAEVRAWGHPDGKPVHLFADASGEPPPWTFRYRFRAAPREGNSPPLPPELRSHPYVSGEEVYRVRAWTVVSIYRARLTHTCVLKKS